MPERMIRSGSPDACRGFTLVELGVTLTVLAILVGLAVPSFANMTQRNRLTAAANELVAALQTARVEAVSRGQSVALCPSNAAAQQCVGSDWSRLIVFIDADRNGVVEAPDDEVLRSVVIDGAGLHVNASPAVGGKPIRFAPDGLVRVETGRAASLQVCSDRLTPESNNARAIRIAVSRVAVEQLAAADCEEPSDVSTVESST